jgi:hypothetical protein
MTNNFNLADAIANIIRYKLDPGDNAAYGALMADD